MWVPVSSRLQGCPKHSGPLFPRLQNRGQNQRVSGTPLHRHIFDFTIHLNSQKAFLSPAKNRPYKRRPPRASLSETTHLFCGSSVPAEWFPNRLLSQMPPIPWPPGTRGPSEPTGSFQANPARLEKLRTLSQWSQGPAA